jgi:hypothetical protein
VERFLNLVLSGRHRLPELAAITFTRKAAGEMRERVLEALLDARAGKQGKSEHEKTTLALAATALARDTAGAWGVTDNPARLRIQTIDSLCAALTRQMPMLSRFGAQPESIEDAAAISSSCSRTSTMTSGASRACSPACWRAAITGCATCAARSATTWSRRCATSGATLWHACARRCRRDPAPN